MKQAKTKQTSKFLSLVLRHQPQEIGITLDEAGWVDVDELLAGMARHGKHISRETLEHVVRTNDKRRFVFSEDGRRIRANQGHSVEVELGYKSAKPPDILLHGTPEKFVEAIRREGLCKMNRHHVHLHVDVDTARAVGSRRGRPMLLKIRAAEMHEQGHEFFVTPNNVWLVDRVPVEFIEFPEELVLKGIHTMFRYLALFAAVFVTASLVAAADSPPRWKNPIEKQGYLGSPLVEVTPLSFKGKLYLLECWRSRWDWPRRPEDGENMWMAELPQGPERYDSREYLGRVMKDHILGTAIVWNDRVYVYGTNESKGRREVSMTWSDDMLHWSEPVKVFDSPKGSIFNMAVTRNEQGMVFLWETNGYGKPFTMCYGRVDKPTDPWNPGIIEGARYGMHKYTGGPALYYEGGWYYTLYLEALPGRNYETRVTRSKDLKNWQDAPAGRPLITFDPGRTCLLLRPKQIKECNASDVELCCHKGKTILYYTGGNQLVGGDLQWATYNGTPRELLEHFFRP